MAGIKSARTTAARHRANLRRAELQELARARRRVGKRGGSSSSRIAGRTGPAPDALTASVTLFVGACVCSFLFFANPYLSPFETYRFVNSACLLWIPAITILLVMKQDIQHFGMSRGDRKLGLRLAAIAIVCMLPLLVAASLEPQFRSYYSNMIGQPLAMVGYAVRPGWAPPVRPLGVVYYELGQGMYMFCWEFFFRGFLLFGLARARWLGNIGAIVAQSIPFALLHWSIVPGASKPPIEIASAVVGGIILGWLAVRTRSFFYGFLIHWGISAILDLLVIVSLLHLR